MQEAPSPSVVPTVGVVADRLMMQPQPQPQHRFQVRCEPMPHWSTVLVRQQQCSHWILSLRNQLRMQLLQRRRQHRFPKLQLQSRTSSQQRQLDDAQESRLNRPSLYR